jgi:hypothetical protein
MVAAAVAGVVGFAGALPAAAAQDGLTVSSESVYTVTAGAKAVKGEITVTVKNVTPSQGNTFYYWADYSIPIPKGSKNIKATSQGSALTVRTESSDYPSEIQAVVVFPARLLYGHSLTFTLSFDIVGAPPRSSNLTRLSPGYASFTVIGPGDPGAMKVTVVAPKSYEVDSSSKEFTEDVSGDTRTLSATQSPGGDWFWALVTARDPRQIDETPLRIGDNALTLEAYPGDTEWSRFVGTTMSKGVPVLERLVGTPWPGELRRVREDSSVRLHGLGGYFDPQDDEIVIGEDLDTALLFHETSHAWVNGSIFDARWMYEGLAELLAQKAVKATGGTPDATPTIARDAPHNQPLSQWRELLGGDSGDPDTYGYPASQRVMTELFKGASDAEMAAILKAALAGDTAYDYAGGTLQRGVTDWRGFLDLVESGGGNPNSAQVLSTWVLDDDEKAQLKGRPQARKAYAAIDSADGAWLPPMGLRLPMTSWSFEKAQTVASQITSAAPLVQAVQQAAKSAGLTVPKAVVQLYEAAEKDADLRALAATMTAARDATTDVVGATAAATEQRNILGDLGARVLGVEGDAQSAATAYAAGSLAEASTTGRSAIENGRRATLVGVAVVAGALLLIGLLVGVVWRWLRRRRSVAAVEQAEHSGVAQGIGLDPLEVQELGDPLVIGAQQLGEDLGGDRLPLDRLEAVASEEVGLEGQAEQARDSELAGTLDEGVEQTGAQPATEQVVVNGESADLTEVLPEDMHRPATDHP